MLNPPLSLLPKELLDSIVGHVEKLPPFNDKTLYNLSLADRAFTQSCQKYIFRNFEVSNDFEASNSNKIPENLIEKLKMAKKILDYKPSFANHSNHVRTVKLAVSRDECAWLFNDPTFISILQLLAKSPMPPHELHFGGHMFASFIIQDPILVVRRLAQSFFSQTLTILRLVECKNVPLSIFLICPRLREVFLRQVGAEMSYDEYPDNQCSGREPPSLEVFDHHYSHSIVKQMVIPPSRFNTPVVLWSSLRILTVTPHEEEGMACLQPILDAACNTLEELYLTNPNLRKSAQPLAGLVNLSNVSRLHVFSLYVIIRCDAPQFSVLDDLNIVLSTIPESNKFTNLALDFNIIRVGLGECLHHDWDGMYKEVIRISDGKPLEVEIQMSLGHGNSEEKDELYTCIMDEAGLLSDYPNICTHFWNPTFWAHGLLPFPRGQVRSRCRR